jgi:hypothetical protein
MKTVSPNGQLAKKIESTSSDVDETIVKVESSLCATKTSVCSNEAPEENIIVQDFPSSTRCVLEEIRYVRMIEFLIDQCSSLSAHSDLQFITIQDFVPVRQYTY